VNNVPRNIPWYLPERARSLLISFLGSNPDHQPYGFQKFVWNPEARRGSSVFHSVIGGQRYNPFFSGTEIDEAGRIHYGTPWGRVRLGPADDV
jgi:hypothetical protein